MGHIVTPRRIRALLGLGLLAAGIGAAPALAQRPFAVHDPFYRGETARRPFFDGYALTTDLTYRTAQSAIGADPLGLSFRAEYQFAPSLDVGAIVDMGGGPGRSLSVSWLTLKYYTTEENTDRALRLAVDPAVDGRLGNPQVDLAYISTTLHRPNLSSDWALGVRRVRLGYEQIVERAPGSPTPDVPAYEPQADVTFTRALGWEAHLMSQYALLLGPARNSIFLSGLLYFGNYDMVESSLTEERANGAPGTDGGAVGAHPSSTEEYLAGAVWLRSGFEYNRPSFQLAPYMSFAVKQWMPRAGARPARLSFGLRFMLR